MRSPFQERVKIEDLPDGTTRIFAVDLATGDDYTCQVEGIFDPETGIYTIIDIVYWKRESHEPVHA